jgi:ribosomal protein S27AE
MDILSEGAKVKKWNHYTCPKCGGVTVARHDDEGVTPFLIRCRAKDTVSDKIHAHGCEGMAESVMFDCIQDDTQTPHVIFFRPEPMQAIHWINNHCKNPNEQSWLLNHYAQGGALMKESYE